MADKSSALTKKAGAGLAAVVAAAGVSDALAGSKSFRTGAELKSVEPEGAKGKVTSKSKKCVRGRKVILHYDESESAMRADPKIGTDRTNKRGRFHIEEPLFAGVYYVKVRRKVIISSSRAGGEQMRKHKIICKGKRSKGKKG